MNKLNAMYRWLCMLTAFLIFCGAGPLHGQGKAAPGQGLGFLKANGHLIVDGKGEKFILRGMGMGGWMLQEGYMFRLGNVGQQHLIKAKIADLVGAGATEKFYDGWLAGHTRKIDVDSMAAWGFNSIRLPMHYRLFTLSAEEEPVPGGNTWLEKGFALTDSLLNWCKANRMYLILDMHAAPGGQGNDLPISDRDPAKPSLWESGANRQKMIALWRKLAERYADEPWIGGYDIINEPNWGFEDAKDRRGTAEKTNAPLKQLLMDITRAIRAVDKKHIIIIEGNGFGNNYNGILPAWDDNMVLSFHKYGNFNEPGSIRRFLELREKYNIPLWMGESGENSNTWFTEAIRLVESNDIGWAWWQLKKIGINNPLEIPLTPSYQRLLDYWNGKGSKPSPTEAQAALNEFLESIRLENNIYHKDVTDAMFRQVRTAATIPFITHFVGDQGAINAAGPVTVNAVDYDLGRQGAAYYDRDTASYQYTPGVKTVGNRGHACRNDGVDIMAPGATHFYYVFSIEDGEWLQYTVQVAKKGIYKIGFLVSATADTGRISLSSGDSWLLRGLAVPATGRITEKGAIIGGADSTGGAMNSQAGPPERMGWQRIQAKGLELNAGANILRVHADKGGWNFASFDLSKGD